MNMTVMNRVISTRARTTLAALSAATMMATSAVLAQAAEPKLAAGVVKAVEGYEAAATKYVVANGTGIFSDHFIYGGKIMGQLKRGDAVDALAKVKGYDWILVGKGGVGIGYIPISLLAPADSYRP
jgi:hypothetical protein